jgi:tetratricopeptide (TPR) repeat protein
VRPKRQRRDAPAKKAASPAARPLERPASTTAFIYVGLAAINIIAFASVRRFEFVDYDDIDYISSNPNVAAGLTWDSVRWALTTGYSANWHPLTWMSHMLDVQLFGMNPGAHHVVNLVLHVLSTVLLFGVLHRMTGETGKSAFVAALFAVHPLHVESVAWAAERKDVLSTVFFMLTLWAYLYYVRQPSWRRYVGVAVCLALGLMAKPMLVTLPILLLLLDLWPLKRPMNVKLVTEKLPLLALSVASSVITVLVQRQGGAVMRLDQVPLSLRLANAPIAYVHYIGKMFWPAGLVAMYPLPREIPAFEVAGALAILLAVSVIVARAGRRHPYLAVGWLWFIIALLPVIGIVQVGAQSSADRYTYMPVIGLFLMIAWGVSEAVREASRRTLALRLASAAIVTTCTVLSFRQVQHWRNSLALWQHAVDATPDSFFAHTSLGYVLWKSGKLDDAIVQYNESLRLRSDFAETHNNLGVALAQKGQLAAALPHFSEAIRQKPSFTAARDNFSATDARMRTLNGELARYAEGVRSRPDDLAARNEFGAALAGQGRIDEAIEQFVAALQIDSSQADVHYNLGMMLERKGRTKDAIAAFEAALRHNPKHDAAREAITALSRGVAKGGQK